MACAKETAGVSTARRSPPAVTSSPVQGDSVFFLPLPPLAAFINLSIQDNFLPFCDKTMFVQDFPLGISYIGHANKMKKMLHHKHTPRSGTEIAL
jgi:hypothetical protein